MRTQSRPRPTVVIVGAGASGTLAALHLVRTARLRSIALDILLLTRGTIGGEEWRSALLTTGTCSTFPRPPCRRCQKTVVTLSAG